MHDCYDARWRPELVLDSLPLAIRQERYGQLRPKWNRPKWHEEAPPPDSVLQELSHFNARAVAIPGPSGTVFAAYGIRKYPTLQSRGCPGFAKAVVFTVIGRAYQIRSSRGVFIRSADDPTKSPKARKHSKERRRSFMAIGKSIYRINR